MTVQQAIKTLSLCGVCYRELEAERQFRDDGAVWIVKTCPQHGYQEAIAENNALFWNMIARLNTRKSNTFTHIVYNNMSMIEVTDRCNVQCKHCYHSPDNKTTDRSADWIIAKALTCHTPTVCLMGAEPTMRDDLPEICAGIKKGGKNPTTYTNGVRLRDKDYVKRLKDGGLCGLSMSIHNPEYHTDKVWSWVMEGLKNVLDANIPLGQISFTVESQEQVKTALAAIVRLWSLNIRPTDYCIRSPAVIGVEFEQSREIFASEVFEWLRLECAAAKLPFKMLQEHGSNPYHVGAYVGVANVQVIHWPSVHSVDLAYMDMGPWANFIDNTKGSFVVQALMRDGIKKGWFLGCRIVPDGASRFTLYDVNAEKKEAVN
jgi:hypothetical protein